MATTSTSQSRPGITQDLRSSTAYLLKRLGFAVKDRWVAAYEPTGLMPQHQAVLSLLTEGTCTTQGQIAERLNYDASQVVDFLDDLEQRGLVTRRRDPADRRRHIVTVTPEGHEKLQELTTLTKSVEKDFLAPLDADERRTLHDLLLRLAAHHDARFGS